MKSALSLLLASILILVFAAGVCAEETDAGTAELSEEIQNATTYDGAVTIDLNSDCQTMTQEESQSLVYSLYDIYCASAMMDPDRIQETTYYEYTTLYDNPGDVFKCGTLTFNGYEMKYGIQIVGEPDEAGKYPLYLALHGGGQGEASTNDRQWEDMFYYYRYSVKNGIYINVRGIADTWNLHFLDESYYLYDRLIEDMILFENADPNRVYIMGFSAGGDGVYQVAAHMADRFAAADMSSGHPNDVSMKNLANLPIVLQAGIRDCAYDRSLITVEYGNILDSLADSYGFGYDHTVFIHVPEGHNYADNDSDESALQMVLADPLEFVSAMSDDSELRELIIGSDTAYTFDMAYVQDDDVNETVMNAVNEIGLEITAADTNAVRWVSGYTRDPFPAELVWDLDTRAAQRTVESFYYLKAPAETKGTLTSTFDKDENAIYVDAFNVDGDFSVLFNPLMLDLASPVKLYVDGDLYLVNATPSEECILASFEETSDIYRAYAAEISYYELLAYRALSQD